MEAACVLCKAMLSLPRRVINPMNSSNEKIREYFLERVCPSDYQFVGETVKYICRLTCHKKMKRLLNFMTPMSHC